MFHVKPKFKIPLTFWSKVIFYVTIKYKQGKHMPRSDYSGKEESLRWINEFQPKTILDIGAGAGTYGILLKNSGYRLDKLDCLEIFEPNINQFGLKDLYNYIYLADVREWEDFNYDLVIFGDVLEHMTKEEALAVWDKCSKQAKHALISIPIVHLPQHDHEEYYDEYQKVLINKHEDHIKDDWSTKEVLDSFSHITRHISYEHVGIFWSNFNVTHE